MKKNVRIGVVCLARTTYDHMVAQEIYLTTIRELKKIEAVEWEFINELVIEVEDANKAALRLKEKHLDGLVIITGTFHLGHLALILKKQVDKPTLLWAFSELPYNGGKIRLNSVCGLNLNASNLYKAGFNDVVCIVGDDIDQDWLDAIRMKSALENARLGITGYRADGFFNLGIDELHNFFETGILIDHYELIDLISIEVTSEETFDYEKEIREDFDCSGITQEQIQKVSQLCVKFEKFMKTHNFTGLAIRCWPEFANMFGISPCAAMSILQSKGYILGCEGDIEGVMSMIICQAIGVGTPFLADFSQINSEEDFGLLWHCGVAPKNLWDGQCVRSLDTYFAGGRGVTADFVMKTGRINLVRIDSARGKTRLYFQGGDAVPMDKLLKGTYAKVVFDKHVDEVIQDVFDSGVAHHLSMIYGDRKRVFEIFAKIMGYEII